MREPKLEPPGTHPILTAVGVQDALVERCLTVETIARRRLTHLRGAEQAGASRSQGLFVNDVIAACGLTFLNLILFDSARKLIYSKYENPRMRANLMFAFSALLWLAPILASIFFDQDLSRFRLYIGRLVVPLVSCLLLSCAGYTKRASYLYSFAMSASVTLVLGQASYLRDDEHFVTRSLLTKVFSLAATKLYQNVTSNLAIEDQAMPSTTGANALAIANLTPPSQRECSPRAAR